MQKKAVLFPKILKTICSGLDLTKKLYLNLTNVVSYQVQADQK